jgi:exodeoxyribonuclease V beta subunit
MTREFDVGGPLPIGVTVLEASAGTGKTWTIAALAARYVAEGTPLERLLLVTFTRMATGELRERVRERLVRDLGKEHDPLRRERLARAVADFDAATIATTHGFCQEVLSGLGVAGDVERDAEFVEDVGDLVEEVVDDLYVRRFHRGGGPAFTREEAGRIASIAVANPLAPIEPRGADEATLPAMRARLAGAVRDELDRRKQRAAVMTYDDLLTRLNATLEGPGGDAVARRLRGRFHVVLVDEFQDTDPVQWNIMRRAFGGGTLVLIGDPKQAIYAFRGADVYAYLDAARQAATQATLEVNWRSDQGLIDAYDALFGGARLGHEGIVYRQVRATDANQRPRLTGAPVEAPLRIRVVHREDVATTQGGYARNAAAREHIARDLAGDLVRLLNSGARVDGEPVEPGHVAVLVQTNRAAALVRDALGAARIPAVINGAGSVFGTAQAREWLRLLEAIERPSDDRRAHAAALTAFLGWSAERIAGAADEEWEAIHRRLHEWARVLRAGGVASLTETITLAEGLPERVLSAADGERALTDLRHVGQLLHAAATTEQLGTTALVQWLRRRIVEADQDTSDEDRSRRLESDAQAVQVLTVHRSKGLEFPIVYYPHLWEPGYIPPGLPVAYHDPDAGDRRTIDVGLEGPDFDRHKQQHLVEERGEDLRLAYVALTRAKHQAIVWWAPSWNSRDSALGRLLFARAADGTVPAVGRGTPSDAAAVQRFETLAAEAPGRISVERARLELATEYGAPLRPPAELTAERFERPLDRRWRRTSFSDITSGAHEARVGSEPEEGLLADEPEAPVRPAAPAGDEALHAVPSLLGEMPAGTSVGTFVHRVLEATDFAAADLEAELAGRVAEVQARRAVDIGDPRAAIAGLRAAIETPLGGGLRLRDLARADRLDELAFELPLVGGEAPTGDLALDAVAAVLRAHLPAGDPLAGYADRLADPALRRSVRGYVTGSIDLVARAGERFTVVDYKTNWLGAPGEELTAWHHRPAALAAEMERGHYGLQALLYTVALHRYLRWRMPVYDPERHLGGVLYLFVRGMTGPDTPVVDGTPCGVFAWRPPAALVEALSDALDRP